MVLLNLSHILVQHRYEAEDLLRKLKAGESFESLAQKFSICSSASACGKLGPIQSSRLEPVFAEAAEALAAGTQSEIVKTRFGHHIILRHD